MKSINKVVVMMIRSSQSVKGKPNKSKLASITWVS